MIRVVARHVFRPGMVEQALKFYEELVSLSRADDGCLEYTVNRHAERENELAVIESWRDEAALQQHLQAPHFTRLVPQIGALVESSQVDIYQLLF